MSDTKDLNSKVQEVVKFFFRVGNGEFIIERG